MVEVLQTSCNYVLHKCGKRPRNLEDLISELPNEVLISILSLLTMKDAARTSVLSTRWRYLWCFFTGNLDFEHSESSRNLVNSLKQFEVERGKFIRWVNQVLKSLKAPTIDRFKVRFDMSYAPSSDVDHWIKFAIERRVRKLELDFAYYMSKNSLPEGRYTIPCQFLICSSFNSLTYLRLDNLNVTREVVEYFLSSCPSLESLSVIHSSCLVSLQVSGPLLKLKHLELELCFNLVNLEISAENLAFFKYSGPRINILFKSVPRLVEASLGGRCSTASHEFGVLSQLGKLALDFSSEFSIHCRFPKHFKFSNLQQLEVVILALFPSSFIYCMSLLEAAPLLRKFVLKLKWCTKPEQGEVKVDKVKKCLHHSLKVVEVVGFVGCNTDIQIAMYLIKNAVLLEKLIIDFRWVTASNRLEDRLNCEMKEIARNRALELRTELPSGAELLML